MKIALIANSTYPIIEPFVGGLEKITYLLARTLMERGLEVDLYGHPDSDPLLNVQDISSETDKDRRVYKNLSQSEDTDIDNLSEQMGYIRAMTKIRFGNYDVVHNHAYHYIPMVMGNILNVPMITSAHTPPVERLQYGSLGIKGNNRMVFTMVSKSLAETWNRWIPNATVVYNGVEIEKWPFIAQPAGEYLFWYGRICEEKGTRLAIEAAELANIPLKIAGPVFDERYFEKSIRPLIKEGSVDYLGHLNQSQLAPLVGNAKAVLFSSLWDEPFGLTLIESMACGTPIVAFEGGAVSEILNKDCGIIVPNGSVKCMASAIAKVLSLSRYSCRKHVELKFSYQIMVDKYLRLYDSMRVKHLSRGVEQFPELVAN